jgi:hypothetical protein
MYSIGELIFNPCYITPAFARSNPGFMNFMWFLLADCVNNVEAQAIVPNISHLSRSLQQHKPDEVWTFKHFGRNNYQIKIQ